MSIETREKPNNQLPDENLGDIDPIDVAKGAAILVGFKFVKGAIRGGYRRTREEVGSINAELPDDISKTERAKTILTELPYRKILIAAAEEGKNEVVDTIQFIIGSPQKTPNNPKIDIMPGNGVTNPTIFPQRSRLYPTKATRAA